MLARIRKALIAGLGAGVAAAVGALVAAGSVDRDTVSKALGVGVTAAAATGWATWRIPNKPTYAVGGVVKGPVGPLDR